jgi:hypothetical protein
MSLLTLRTTAVRRTKRSGEQRDEHHDKIIRQAITRFPFTPFSRQRNFRQAGPHLRSAYLTQAH